MRRLLLGLLTNAVAIWLTTLVVSGVRVDPYEEGATAAILTYLLVAVIFGVVNAVVGGVVRVVAFPCTSSRSAWSPSSSTGSSCC